jgi:hypothetical protein
MRHDEPQDDVEQHAMTTREGQQDKDQTDEGWIDIQILAQAAAHTGDPRIGSTTIQFALHGYLSILQAF